MRVVDCEFAKFAPFASGNSFPTAAEFSKIARDYNTIFKTYPMELHKPKAKLTM